MFYFLLRNMKIQVEFTGLPLKSSNAVPIKASSVIKLMSCYCMIIRYTDFAKDKARNTAARNVSIC